MPKTLFPVLALMFNAFIWGLAWWPFRQLQAAGLHPLWATALLYAVVLAGLLLARPAALRSALAHPGLWLLALSSGLNNVAFNWAMTVGDVVRVILLFYLMPAWAVLLAWKILGERPTRAAFLRLLLAFAGVALVLLPDASAAARLAGGLSMADVLALTGGFCFALTNVTLRRLNTVPGDARMLAMFAGCCALGALGACAGLAAGLLPPPPAPAPGWVLLGLGLAGALLLGNYALQFGAARLAAGTTALVMLSEVVFASVSSVLLTSATLAPRTVLGGALILLAALLAALPRRGPRPAPAAG